MEGEAIDIKSFLFVYVIFILVGFLMIFIGLFIRKSKKIELLSQYNREKNYDRDSLANFAGNNLFMMGLLIVLFSLAYLIILVFTKSVIWLNMNIFTFIILVSYFAFKVAFGVKRFEI
jgi:hypothetical protein